MPENHQNVPRPRGRDERRSALHHIRVLSGWVKHLGFKDAGEFVPRSWPIWDGLFAIINYDRGQPVMMSAAAMEILGAEHRCDMTNAPKFKADLAPYRFSSETHPAWGHSYGWSVAFLGELDEPAPYLPYTDLDYSQIITGGRAIFPLHSGYRAIRHAHSKIVGILDDGTILPIDQDLPISLGYDRDDTSWVPERWRTPLAPGPLEAGFDTVATGDGEPVTLRWSRMNTGRVSAYYVRLGFDIDDLADDATPHERGFPISDYTAPVLLGTVTNDELGMHARKEAEDRDERRNRARLRR